MTDLPLEDIRRLVAELRAAYDDDGDVDAAIDALEAAVAGEDGEEEGVPEPKS